MSRVVEDACVTCRAREGSPVFVLVEHSAYQTDVRYKFMRTEAIEHSSLAPYVFPMCTQCFRRADRGRRRVKRALYTAGAGFALSFCYFAAALLQLPSAISVGLLFSGCAIVAVMMAVVVVTERGLVASLPLPKLPGRKILVLSTDRTDLERVLEQRKLISMEIRNEIDRIASGTAALPRAELVDPNKR